MFLRQKAFRAHFKMSFYPCNYYLLDSTQQTDKGSNRQVTFLNNILFPILFLRQHKKKPVLKSGSNSFYCLTRTFSTVRSINLWKYDLQDVTVCTVGFLHSTTKLCFKARILDLQQQMVAIQQ